MTSKIQEYASDPLAFFAGLIIPSVSGPCRFSDCWADFQVETFQALAPALVAVARGEKPPIGAYWLERTKGGSKDSDLACCLLWLLAYSRKPLLVQVGAADQDQADEMRKAAKDILRLNPWLSSRVEVQNWRIVSGDSQCQILSADTAGSHGARPDVLVINELSHITKQEFAENLIDNSAKVPHGIVCIATNAGHTGTWQYQWRELALESPRWFFHQWSQPAPWLDPAAVDEASRRNTATRFNRLFYGVWSPNSGDALDPQLIEDAVTLQGPQRHRLDGWAYIAGLDLGVTNDHSAVVTLGCQVGSSRIALVDCRAWAPPRGGQVNLAEVESYVVSLDRRLHLTVWADNWQSILMQQNLKRRGLRVETMNFVGQNLNIMASALLDVFSSRTIDLYHDKDLIRDLGRLSIVERSYGYKLESTRDADGHADRATALAIALPAAMKLAHLRAIVPTAPTYAQRDVSPSRHGVLLDNGMSRPRLFSNGRN